MFTARCKKAGGSRNGEIAVLSLQHSFASHYWRSNQLGQIRRASRSALLGLNRGQECRMIHGFTDDQ